MTVWRVLKRHQVKAVVKRCTRLRTIRVYPNKKAESTIHFLGEILNTFPFPVQRIQTDWGTEFFNYDFQYELHDHFIKFRPIKPRTPHLNGKVERSQQGLDLRSRFLPQNFSSCCFSCRFLLRSDSPILCKPFCSRISSS